MSVATSAGNVLVWMVWVVAAFACLASGIAVISFANPFYSALALIGNLGSLAVMYLLLSAEFVAAAQVLVYAGAVVVMFLFVIAYVGPRAETPWSGGPGWQTVGAVAAAGALLVEIVVAVGMQASGSLCTRPIGATSAARLDRPRLPHRSPARVRDHVGGAARRGRRRRHPRLPARSEREADLMSGPDVAWYLASRRPVRDRRARRADPAQHAHRAALARAHAQRGNLALIALSRHWRNGAGQIFALAVMAIAASEVCVGLGLVVALNRRNLSLDVDTLSELRG